MHTHVAEEHVCVHRPSTLRRTAVIGSFATPSQQQLDHAFAAVEFLPFVPRSHSEKLCWIRQFR